MDLGDMETGDVVFGPGAYTERRYSPNTEFHLLLNTSHPTPGNEALSAIPNLNNAPTADREGNCEIHPELASFSYRSALLISHLSRVTITSWISTAQIPKASF